MLRSSGTTRWPAVAGSAGVSGHRAGRMTHPRARASGRAIPPFRRRPRWAEAACAWLVAAGIPAGSQRAECPPGSAGPPGCREADACYEQQLNGSFSPRAGLCQGGTCVHASAGQHTCVCPPGSVLSNGGSGVQRLRCCPDPSPCPNGRRAADDKCRLGGCSCDGPCLPGCDTCQNDGVCVAHSVLGRELLTCQCPVGFSGEDCSIAEFADACDLRPCQNGATCLPMFGQRQCQCAPGFSGEDCEVATHDVCVAQYRCDPRHTAACQHGNAGVTHCHCVAGFRGERCEDMDVALLGDGNPCESSPCQNGGECEVVPGGQPPAKLVAVGIDYDSSESDLFTLTVPDTGFSPDTDCNRTIFEAGCKIFMAFAPDGQRVMVQVDASVQPYTVVQVPVPHQIGGADASETSAGGAGGPASPDTSLAFRCVCSSGFIGTLCEISEQDLPGLVQARDVFGNCGRPGSCCAAGGVCSQVFHYAACECREGWGSTPGAASPDCAVPGGQLYDPDLHSATRSECVRPTTTGSVAAASTHVLPADEVLGPSSGAAWSGQGSGGEHGSGRSGGGGGVGALSTQSGTQQSQFGFYAGTALGSLCLVTMCFSARRWHRLKKAHQFSSEKAVEQMFEMRGSNGDDGFGGFGAAGTGAEGSIYRT